MSFKPVNARESRPAISRCKLGSCALPRGLWRGLATKSRTALLLLMLSGVATADPVVRSVESLLSQKAGMVDLASSGNGFGCAPSPLGAGTFPTIRSNSAGSVAWWYCPSSGGGWRINWAVATAEQMSVSNLMAQAHAVVTAADPKAAFAAAVARSVSLPIDAPALTAVWRPFAVEMVAGIPPNRTDASARVATAPASAP